MSKFIDLFEKKFGRLTVVRRVNNDKRGRSKWLCQCNCSDKNKIIVLGSHLKSNHTKSCGCLSKETASIIHTKHGHCQDRKESKIYCVWEAIIQRCTNLNHPQYKDYGGRSIAVCERWLKFENFLEDMEKPPTNKHQIDRINNDYGYFPSNCRWVVSKINNCNKSNNHLVTHLGRTQCVAAWAEEYQIPYSTLWNRLYKLGWSPEKTLTTPVRKKRNK